MVFTVLLAFGFLGLSCNKTEDKIPGFDMFYQQYFTIPVGISQFQVHHFEFENFPTKYQTLLDTYKKTDADITSILTGKAAVTGVFGDANLDFIDQISVRVYDSANPNDFLEIAYRYPVPLEPGNSVALIPTLADSKRFFKMTRVSVDVVIWLRFFTTEESEVRLDLQMNATL